MSIDEGLIDALQKIDDVKVSRNVDLSRLSRWRIGGVAQLLVIPHSKRALADVLGMLKFWNSAFVVIGETSNLLFSDEGLEVPCVKISTALGAIEQDGPKFRVDAGTWVPHFARVVARAGYSGIEHLCGIPGTLGGLICMNGGSQRKAVSEYLASVIILSTSGRRQEISKKDCNFSYRSSIFQHDENVIIEACFEFRVCREYKEIRKEMLDIMSSRRHKFPSKSPNCGSVFVSNPELYAKIGPPGRVIESLGLKGVSIGGASVSKEHANFIINDSSALASDVLALISLVRTRVESETGVKMDTEARIVSRYGRISPISKWLDEGAGF